MREIEQEVWHRAEVIGSSWLRDVLSSLLDSYERKPGKDEVVRVMPACIGERGYRELLEALLAKSRKDVRYYDHGWHLELRSRLWEHLIRGLQKLLVSSGQGSEVLAEDLLAFDVGV